MLYGLCFSRRGARWPSPMSRRRSGTSCVMPTSTPSRTIGFGHRLCISLSNGSITSIPQSKEGPNVDGHREAGMDVESVGKSLAHFRACDAQKNRARPVQRIAQVSHRRRAKTALHRHTTPPNFLTLNSLWPRRPGVCPMHVHSASLFEE